MKSFMILLGGFMVAVGIRTTVVILLGWDTPDWGVKYGVALYFGGLITGLMGGILMLKGFQRPPMPDQERTIVNVAGAVALAAVGVMIVLFGSGWEMPWSWVNDLFVFIRGLCLMVLGIVVVVVAFIWGSDFISPEDRRRGADIRERAARGQT